MGGDVHTRMHAHCLSFLFLQMTKKIKKLEKETTQWRSKWESNNQALLQMAEEVTLSFDHKKTCSTLLKCGSYGTCSFFSLHSVKIECSSVRRNYLSPKMFHTCFKCTI